MVRLQSALVQTLRRKTSVFHNLTLLSIPGGVDSTTTKVKEIQYASQQGLWTENHSKKYKNRD